MKILLTGSSGFLGSHILQFLFNNYEVKVLKRSTDINSSKISLSIADFDSINWFPDVIIMAHAAVASGIQTPSNAELFEGNVRYTEVIAKRFPDAHIIYTSSVSVYKVGSGLYNESSTVTPTSPYAISKWWGEQIVSNLAKSTIIRFPSLYGPGMKENTILPNYVKSAIMEKRIKVWGDGKRLQNYLHVNDACGYIDAILVSLSVLKRKILLGTSLKSFTNIELASIISKELDATIDFVYTDTSASFEYENEITKNILSFSPVMDFEQGVKQYISWKKKQ